MKNKFGTFKENKNLLFKTKICLLGEASVGKTCLISRFVEDKFDDKYIKTIGTKISFKEITNLSVDNYTDEKKINMNFMVWDVIGQKGFEPIISKYFKGSHGGLLVVDASRPKTMDHMRHWRDLFYEIVGEVPIVVFINKSDLIDVEDYHTEKIEKFCEEFNFPYLFTSAKTGENVELGFKKLAEIVLSISLKTKVKKSLVNVVDELIVDFSDALGGFDHGMPIINEQFKKAKVGITNPTKEQVLLLLENLVNISKEFQEPKKVKFLENKYRKILNSF